MVVGVVVMIVYLPSGIELCNRTVIVVVITVAVCEDKA